MKYPFKLILFVGLFIIAGGALILFGNDKTQKNKTSAPLKIGSLAHLTGFGSVWGIAEQKAVLLRVKELQSEGSVRVEMIVEDCASDIKLCISAAQKLIQVDKVQAIIGPTWDEWFEPIAPLANQYKVPLISPSGGSEQSYQPFAFSLKYSVESTAQAILRFAQERNASRAVMITTNDPHFMRISSAQKKFAKDFRVTIEYEIAVDPDEKSFSTEITKIKQNKPDVIFANLLQTHFVNFVKKAKENGIQSLIVTEAGVEPDANTRSILSGTYYLDFESSVPAEFREKYRKEYDGENPSPSAPMA